MLTISERVLSVIPVETGRITQLSKQKQYEKKTENTFEKQEFERPGPSNYMITQNFPIYTTQLEMYNKGRVVVIKKRE